MRMQFTWLSLAILFVMATVVSAGGGPPPPPPAEPVKAAPPKKLPGNGIKCDGSRPLNYNDCDFLILKLEAAEKGHVIPECLENGKGYAWAHGNCFISIQNKTPAWGHHCTAPAQVIARIRKTLHKCSPDKSATNNESAKRKGKFHWTEIRISPNKASQQAEAEAKAKAKPTKL